MKIKEEDIIWCKIYVNDPYTNDKVFKKKIILKSFFKHAKCCTIEKIICSD